MGSCSVVGRGQESLVGAADRRAVGLDRSSARRAMASTPLKLMGHPCLPLEGEWSIHRTHSLLSSLVLRVSLTSQSGSGDVQVVAKTNETRTVAAVRLCCAVCACRVSHRYDQPIGRSGSSAPALAGTPARIAFAADTTWAEERRGRRLGTWGPTTWALPTGTARGAVWRQLRARWRWPERPAADRSHRLQLGPKRRQPRPGSDDAIAR